MSKKRYLRVKRYIISRNRDPGFFAEEIAKAAMFVPVKVMFGSFMVTQWSWNFLFNIICKVNQPLKVTEWQG